MPVEEEYASSANRLKKVVEAPVQVAVIVPRPYVYTHLPDPHMAHATMMGGPIAGGIAGIIDARVRKVQAPHLARLNEMLDPATWAPLIVEQLTAKLPESPLADRAQIVAYPDAGLARGAVSAVDTPVLALFVHVRLDPGHTSLEIRGIARMANGKAALAPPAKDKFDYAQVLTYRIDSGLRGSVAERAAHWSSLSPEHARRIVTEGLHSLTDMLAYDLGQKPRKGRQPGRQVAVDASYAVVETTRGDRSWLRARNGQLFSVTTSSLD